MISSSVALAEPEEASALAFAGIPLSIVFAEGEAIESIRQAGEGELPLEPPFHVSDEDAYLVLPEDIGVEIVDIMRDGDLELLHESLRDGLLVIGALRRLGPGSMCLVAEVALTPASALPQMPFVEVIEVGGGVDPLLAVEALEELRCTVASELLDEEGFEQILRRPERAGASWKVPIADRARLVGVEPTYAWSRHLPEGGAGIELALFQEYEELVALLRPLRFMPA